MPAPQFLIVGTGRSGTCYIAGLLVECGIWCGHENWFTPVADRRRHGMDGEASWYAVDSAREFPGPIFHQVREPRATIASLRMFEQVYVGRGFIHDTGDPLRNAVRIYYLWNLLCEDMTSHRWRLEDVGMRHLARIAASIGFPLNEERAAAALATQPHDANHRQETQPLAWKDLPDDVWTERVQHMAIRYGYEVAG